MHVTSFHQAKHLTSIAAHVQSLAIELTSKRIQRCHNVGDGLVTMSLSVTGFSVLGFFPNAGICFLYHLFAKINANQIVLKDVVIEHVFGGLAQIDDPFAHVGRTYPEGHVLSVHCAGRVIVTADATDSAGYEVRVAWILSFHEDAIAAKNR